VQSITYSRIVTIDGCPYTIYEADLSESVAELVEAEVLEGDAQGIIDCAMDCEADIRQRMASGVLLDLEDAQAIAQHLREHLQYDEGADFDFWAAILSRLETSIQSIDEA
jgi:hypothetical protein